MSGPSARWRPTRASLPSRAAGPPSWSVRPTPTRPGRPRKEPAEAPGPKRPRGRPRKDQGVEIDLHATASAPLESAPSPFNEAGAGGPAAGAAGEAEGTEGAAAEGRVNAKLRAAVASRLRRV